MASLALKSGLRPASHKLPGLLLFEARMQRDEKKLDFWRDLQERLGESPYAQQYDYEAERFLVAECERGELLHADPIGCNQ